MLNIKLFKTICNAVAYSRGKQKVDSDVAPQISSFLMSSSFVGHCHMFIPWLYGGKVDLFSTTRRSRPAL